MGYDTVESLAQRVAQLERENRRWRVGLILAVVLLVAAGVPAWTWSAVTPEEIRAKRFVLVDDAGNERGSLGFLGAGEPWLSLSNRAGDEVSLVIGNEGPKLSLWTSDRQRNVQLGILSGGSPVLQLNRPPFSRIELVLTKDSDEPRVLLRDARGHVFWRTPGR